MRSKTPVLLTVCLVLSLPLFAQHEHPQMSAEQMKMMEAYQKAGTPGEAHKALEGMVGTWNTVIKFYPAPGSPAQESTGVSENRWILGGRYLEQRFQGSAMGQPFEGVGYTAYDNIRKQYAGTWMDSMSTAIMTTTGSATGPGQWKFTGSMDDPVTGKSQPMEETITVDGPDKHTFVMMGPGPDGKMFKTMEIVYTRKK
jgi:hypothetical protein